MLSGESGAAGLTVFAGKERLALGLDSDPTTEVSISMSDADGKTKWIHSVKNDGTTTAE